ncbi:tetratricopeptide (TPR) repeat protein [Weissella uvarum]|uniref:tetratricopeptide repeat protein n=1 Tax=Weissella uvarum TaxID=1479233 RepID=UPI00195F4D6F|nr:tetratricopeptide repeat protein [Weissella uvarum]MBM7617781.1 tetratricopeptide (TPR) repeat protein [Weissella uvarum]MCM0595840.1 tetratricopeptide repeat protein [Weissella uvarum]
MAEERQAKLQEQVHQLVEEIENKPDEWAAYADLVTALTASGNFVQAEELGLKSLTLFEANAEAQAYLAYAVGNNYYAAGHYHEAQNFFQKVDNPKLAHDATMMQAQSWYAQKNYKQALAFTLTGIDQQPDDADAQVLLGNIWLALNDFAAATRAFEQALAVDPDNFEANFGRGLIATVQHQENPWFEQAKRLDASQFSQKTQQLDDLVNVMTGGEETHESATKSDD